MFWGLHTLPSGEIKGFKCAEKMTAFHLTVDCHLGISMDQLFLCWWQSQYIPSGIWSIWDEINHPSWLEARQQKKTNKTEPIWPYGTVTYLWYGHHMAIIWPYGTVTYLWTPMEDYGYQDSPSYWWLPGIRNLFACDTWIANRGTAQEDPRGRCFMVFHGVSWCFMVFHA